MTKHKLNSEIETTEGIPHCGFWRRTSLRVVVEAGHRKRPVRVSFPARRRASCVTRRALLAALREAEFDNWQASGGDYLNSMHLAVL